MSPRVLDDLALARWRFRTLLLDGASAPDAPSAVRSLLAVQAENLEQTAWALASRTSGLTRTGLAGLLASGELVRLHVLRPTWHLVHRDDVRWLLELTGPRVRHQVGRQLERDLGLPSARVAALGDRVEEVLTVAPDRTRDELADALREAGEEVTGMQLMVLLTHLELGLRVGSGRPRPDGGTGRHTYAPLGQRLPASPSMDRAEALGELARRYAVGHGPVTERDLAYWATLPLGDVRAGLAAAAGGLGSFEHDGRTWWHAPGEEPPARSRTPRVHLVHLLDEWYRGYQDSRRVVDVAGLHPVGREPSIGLLVVDAQVAGVARRTVRGGTLAVEVTPYRPLGAAERRALGREAEALAGWLGRELALTVVDPGA
ncbi:winged helix DNA-binding domain-containing protein [Arthrobacter sp. NEB 688]|uniref:winged helix DNA-binding domain-containing protein n=1 Tax=Arthrobacter sp. NEB 688 TaxID=904039 RepID=UPI00156600AC|nr:winged helix DNA-binding domain-containing protein [Arthrobacter sp. NEB 688]QKE83522.1 winged helix DNA-binding domain-containing protein [Arthrobacter sp. NEB 688]